MTIQQAIQMAMERLDSDSSKIDAEFLLCKLLNKNLAWLKTWPDFQLDKQQQKSYLDYLERRIKGEPIAYIIGEKPFWTLQLKTNNSTLIPRSETELLVETALDFLNDLQRNLQEKRTFNILDLGTGTGAIALAIASERPKDSIWACDFNQQAVELALENSRYNKIENVNFFRSDWFSQVTNNNFDLIVANPPYIANNDPHLQQGDLIFEPDSALVAHDNGFADIRLITNNAFSYLNQQGALMIEHGFEQAQKVQEIFSHAGFSQVTTFQDLAGLDRITIGMKNIGIKNAIR